MGLGLRLASLLPGLWAAPLMLAACSAAEPDPAPSPNAAQAGSEAGAKEGLLLFTSLPIYWSEGGVADMLSADASVHWARTALESRYALKPVDTLTALPKDGGLLFMAQPRALSPEENVALDDFVRAGGKVLLIVDPMLDVHSAYGLGDKRRPATMAMLSPILDRWGLRLLADERGEYEASWQGHSFAVQEGGLFEQTGEGHESDCTLSHGDLVARCNVGAGEVLLLADATFLGDGDHAGHDHASGDDTGKGGESLLLDLVQAAASPAWAG